MGLFLYMFPVCNILRFTNYQFLLFLCEVKPDCNSCAFLIFLIYFSILVFRIPMKILYDTLINAIGLRSLTVGCCFLGVGVVFWLKPAVLCCPAFQYVVGTSCQFSLKVGWFHFLKLVFHVFFFFFFFIYSDFFLPRGVSSVPLLGRTLHPCPLLMVYGMSYHMLS